MNLYQSLSALNKIKRRELVLPIARKEVVVSPLSLGDDVSLKTAIVSPVKLDAEVMKLLWKHTDFWKNEDEITAEQAAKKSKIRKEEITKNGGMYYKPREQDFYSTISYFDKLVLLYGLYLVTYGSLGVREFECDECGTKFESDMTLDDAIHDDSLTLFEEEVPFTQYRVPVTIPFNDEYTLEFTTRIPSMSDYNRLVRLIPVEELQDNLEKINNQFAIEHLMTLYTSKLALYKNSDPDGTRQESSTTQEILSSLRDNVNITIAETFMAEYARNFAKYNVDFYREVECPSCKKKHRVSVNIEYELFRRQLSR